MQQLKMPVFLETSKQSIGKLFDTKFDPAIVKLPEVKANNESNIAGLFIIGEVSGIPLIKLGLNQGNRLINQLFENKAPKGRRSKAWEWMNAAILVWAFVATVLICGNMFFGKIYHNDIYHGLDFCHR